MSCCMCEPSETAQSPGDDTHAVAARPKWIQEHGFHRVCGPFYRWVASLAHREVLETRTRAEVTVRPPVPCVGTYRPRTEAKTKTKTKTDQHTTRTVALTTQRQDRTGQGRAWKPQIGFMREDVSKSRRVSSWPYLCCWMCG